MDRLAAFLPPHLLSGGLPSVLPSADRFTAALLVADISGYTALTERMQSRGPEGAEEVIAAVNRGFRPAIRIVDALGGSIANFGGDSLFVLFVGRDRMTRAVSCAEAIRQSFGRMRNPPLRISQVIHHGPVRGLHLGEKTRPIYVVGGAAARAVRRLEDDVGPDEVLLSRAARSRLHAEGSRRARTRTGSRRGASRAAERYVPTHVRRLRRHYRGGYRNVAILFLETFGSRLGQHQSFYGRLRDSLDRYGGILVGTDPSAEGIRWVCAFGVPAPHPDDPDRAARAALAVLDDRPPGLVLRGGLHVGVAATIWLGGPTRRSFEVMGDVTNTAARTLAKAGPNEILMTEEARQTVPRGKFVRRGSHRAKGKSRPLVLHRLDAMEERAPAERFPLVGRRKEQEVIRSALVGAVQGRGGVIAIGGGIGFGKSRLVEESIGVAREAGMKVHRGRCTPSRVRGGVFALLRDAIGLPPSGADATARERARRGLKKLELDRVDQDYLARYLGLSRESVTVDAATARSNVRLAIEALLGALARRQPRLLVLEGYQDADRLTFEIVTGMAERARERPLLLLMTHRLETAAPEGAEKLTLEKLTDADVDELIECSLGESSPSLRRAIQSRTDGNPLFVTETLRQLAGSSERASTERTLAATVESLLLRRFEELSPAARGAAQKAAVLGPTLPPWFTDEGAAIDELRQRQILVVDSEGLAFRPSQLRQVVYDAMLVRYRRRLHRRAARDYERVEPESLGERGAHWEAGGRPQKAHACYREAARRANEGFRLEETVRLYQSCLRVDPTPSPDQIRMRMDLAAGPMRYLGWHREAREVLESAREDSRAIGDRVLEGRCLGRLGQNLRLTGRLNEAIEVFEQAIAVLAEEGERAEEGHVRALLGGLLSTMERFGEGREHLELAVRLLRNESAPRWEGVALGNLSLLELNLDHQAEAARLCRQARKRFKESGAVESEGNSLIQLSAMARRRGRFDVADRHLRRARRILERIGSRRLLGYVHAHLAQNLECLDRSMREIDEHYSTAIAIHRRVGDRYSEGMILIHQSSFFLRTGRAEQAIEPGREGARRLTEVKEALTMGMAWRNLSQVWLENGRVSRARRTLRQALDVLNDSQGRLEARMAQIAQERWIDGASSRGRRRLAALESQVRESDPKIRGLYQVERGHWLLMDGSDARPCLRSVRRLVHQHPEALSALKHPLKGLKAAIAGRKRGAPLIRGESPDRLPEKFRAWLERHRPDAVFDPQV